MIVLGEIVCLLGFVNLIDIIKFILLGLEMNVNYIYFVKDGCVIVIVEIIYWGKLIYVWDIKIKNDKE